VHIQKVILILILQMLCKWKFGDVVCILKMQSLIAFCTLSRWQKWNYIIIFRNGHLLRIKLICYLTP